MLSELSELFHHLSVRLEGVPSWALFLGGSLIAAPAIATPMGDGLDFRSIVHGVGVVVGTIGIVWPAVRTMIRKSDRNTALKVEESQIAIVNQLSKKLDSFEKTQALRNLEQDERNKAVSSIGPRLISIDGNLRDLADVRSEMTGMAFQVGELSTTVARIKNDVDALHNWKRGHEEHHKKGDALLKAWSDEYRRRKLSDPNLTPPTGWDPADGGGKSS